jgi:hypothetical protein
MQASAAASDRRCIYLSASYCRRRLLVRAWVRELRGQLIRSGMASGVPAATPGNVLVSDAPLLFLQALKIPHHTWQF